MGKKDADTTDIDIVSRATAECNKCGAHIKRTRKDLGRHLKQNRCQDAYLTAVHSRLTAEERRDKRRAKRLLGRSKETQTEGPPEALGPIESNESD